MAGELNQSKPNTVGYSATSAPELWKSGWEKRPLSRFNNSPQGHHKHLQMIMLLQVNVHMFRYDSKNYKEVRLRSDWLLFYTVLNYKMDFMNENKVWMKVQLKDVFLKQSILTDRWVYKTKQNWDDAVLKHKA